MALTRHRYSDMTISYIVLDSAGSNLDRHQCLLVDNSVAEIPTCFTDSSDNRLGDNAADHFEWGGVDIVLFSWDASRSSKLGIRL